MNRCLPRAWLLLPLLAALGGGCKRGDPAQAERPSIPEPVALTPAAAGVHRQTVPLPGGGTLRYTVSVPPGYDAAKPVPLVVALHYGGQVTPFYGRGLIDSLVGPALGELGAVVVAPDALGDEDWTSPKNEQAVVWLTRSVLQSYAIDPKKVLVTGFSMGGQGAWFLGGRHPDLFTAALPVAGEPAGAGVDWKIPVYVVHSRDDEILPLGPTERHVEQLKAKGVRVELKVVSGLTHYQAAKYAGALREAVPWLREVWN